MKHPTASHQDFTRNVLAITTANNLTHALIVGCIAIAQDLENTTLQRLLGLAIDQVDELDVVLAGLTQRAQP